MRIADELAFQISNLYATRTKAQALRESAELIQEAMTTMYTLTINETLNQAQDCMRLSIHELKKQNRIHK